MSETEALYLQQYSIVEREHSVGEYTIREIQAGDTETVDRLLNVWYPREEEQVEKQAYREMILRGTEPNSGVRMYIGEHRDSTGTYHPWAVMGWQNQNVMDEKIVSLADQHINPNCAGREYRQLRAYYTDRALLRELVQDKGLSDVSGRAYKYMLVEAFFDAVAEKARTVDIDNPVTIVFYSSERRRRSFEVYRRGYTVVDTFEEFGVNFHFFIQDDCLSA